LNIAYYVSGHGFGHISRSYEIILALLEHKKVDKIFVNTTRKDFVKDKKENLVFREIATDVGIIQEKSISMDLEKTIDAIEKLQKNKKEIIESEIEFLKKEKIDIVFSDSSSLPFAFANKLNIPSYFIGNFTWDFIYQNYTKQYSFFKDYVKLIRDEYSLATFGFILPFHCPMDYIPRKKNIGIIGRSPKRNRKEIRESIRFSEQNQYFLFSFGAYGIPESDLSYMGLKENQWIVVSGYEGLKGNKVMDVKDIYYPDLVRACDYVLTKPGYGILSETYLAGTPIIYTDRGDFAEYDYLVQAMETYHYSAFLSQKELLSMNLESAVQKIEIQRNSRKIPYLSKGEIEILEQIF